MSFCTEGSPRSLTPRDEVVPYLKYERRKELGIFAP